MQMQMMQMQIMQMQIMQIMKMQIMQQMAYPPPSDHANNASAKNVLGVDIEKESPAPLPQSQI